jgi:hypothetical protein
MQWHFCGALLFGTKESSNGMENAVVWWCEVCQLAGTARAEHRNRKIWPSTVPSGTNLALKTAVLLRAVYRTQNPAVDVTEPSSFTALDHSFVITCLPPIASPSALTSPSPIAASFAPRPPTVPHNIHLEQICLVGLSQMDPLLHLATH